MIPAVNLSPRRVVQMSMLRRAILVVLLAVPVTAAGAQSSGAIVPRFERGTCPIEVATDERIDCGTLVVAENRRRPDSRPIRLPVMIFRSRAASPAPDPILFMAGGPGN